MFPRLIDDFIDSYSDERVRGQYSVFEPAMIIATYMIFVNKIGPRLMENRKPLNIKSYVMVFDVIQVVLNSYLVKEVVREIFHMPGHFFCLEMDAPGVSRSEEALFLTKLYYWIKISDLLDTVFFILKKSWRQVSYLHVYHHSIMIFGSWLGIKMAPGGHVAYFGLANAFVHAVMYTYYLLAAYDSRWKNCIALKKMVTQIQLVQFVFIFTMYFPTLLMPSCSLPAVIAIAACSQSLYFIYLFGMFYYNAYIKPSSEPRRTNHNNRS